MEIKDDSIVDSVIEYANMKFGVELSADNVSKQLKQFSLGKTLDIIDAIKYNDDELFLDYIDISVEEAYGTAGTATASAATTRKQNTLANQQMRRDRIASAQRGGGGERSVAGGNKTATGAPAPRDNDGAERAANSAASASNKSEIDRLKDLVMKVANKK